jgi:hypothetical protein
VAAVIEIQNRRSEKSRGSKDEQIIKIKSSKK